MALSSQRVNSPDRWEAGPGGEYSPGCVHSRARPAVCTAARAPLCAQPRPLRCVHRCVHSRARLAVCTAALPHEASVPDSVLPACPSAIIGGPELYPPAPDTQLELTS